MKIKLNCNNLRKISKELVNFFFCNSKFDMSNLRESRESEKQIIEEMTEEQIQDYRVIIKYLK